MTGIATAIGLVSYLVANLGMGLQKHGAPALSRLFSLKDDLEARRLMGLWLLGSVLTVSSSLLLFVALGLGRASVIATFEGLGLVGLALYANRVLGEPLTERDRMSIALIVVGTGLAGYFGTVTEVGADERFFPHDFGWLVGGLALALGVLVALALFRGGRAIGLALGTSAGVCAGLAMMIQKVVGTVLVSDTPLDALRDPWSLAFLVCAGSAFVLLQFAYLHGRALDVVPAYASLNILVPVAAAPMVFGEPAHPVSAIGLILLLAGVVVLARQQVAEAST